MNRRDFTTRLAALFALPAVPALPAAAAPVANVAAVPNAARFWAIYMSHLHGQCSPATLAKMTKIDVTQAQGYLTKLMNDGVIKPNPFLKNTLSHQIKNKADSVYKKIDDTLDQLNDDLAEQDQEPVDSNAEIEPHSNQLEATSDQNAGEEENLTKDS